MKLFLSVDSLNHHQSPNLRCCFKKKMVKSWHEAQWQSPYLVCGLISHTANRQLKNCPNLSFEKVAEFAFNSVESSCGEPKALTINNHNTINDSHESMRE